MNIICPPLKPDHPLVREENLCPICKQQFKESDIVVLVPARESHVPATVPAIVAHKKCTEE